MSSDGSADTMPAVDDHLVVSESGFEIDDGKLVRVPPANEPHGLRHSLVDTVLSAHVTEEFAVAIDMLTRVSATSDIAPDVAVYPRARDLQTGGRKLEELAFEIVSTQSLTDVAGRAIKLVARGVRRVFAVDVRRERLFEWSRDLGTWEVLDVDATLVDSAFARPIPVSALVRETRVDDEIIRAAKAKQNPVLLELLAEARARGHAESIVAVLGRRRIEATAEQRDRILRQTDQQTLQRWLAAAITCTSVDELLDG